MLSARCGANHVPLPCTSLVLLKHMLVKCTLSDRVDGTCIPVKRQRKIINNIGLVSGMSLAYICDWAGHVLKPETMSKEGEVYRITWQMHFMHAMPVQCQYVESSVELSWAVDVVLFWPFVEPPLGPKLWPRAKLSVKPPMKPRRRRTHSDKAWIGFWFRGASFRAGPQICPNTGTTAQSANWARGPWSTGQCTTVQCHGSSALDE